jgi:hypothetical protein
MNILRLLAIIVLSIVAAGCGEPTFDRGIAKTLIDQAEDKQVSTKVIPMHPNAMSMYLAQGFMSNNELKSKFDAHARFSKHGGLEIKEPSTISIDITGIADDPSVIGIKQAEFTWAYDSLPSIVKRFAIKGGTGKATFKLYDDGWRIQDVNFENSKEPFPLTDNDKKEVAQDIETVRLAKQELERFIKEEASITTKVIFEKQAKSKNGIWYVTLTDVYFEAKYVHNGNNSSYNKTERLYFYQNKDLKCDGRRLHYIMYPDYLNRKTTSKRSFLFHSEMCPKLLPEINAAAKAWNVKFGDKIEELSNSL